MNMRNITIFFGIFLAGGLSGAFLFSQFHADPDISNSRQIRQMGGYEFVNPLLECEVADGVIDVRKENFQRDLEEFSEQLTRERGLTDVGIYFRDLNNGPAFGVHQDDGFFPASLLKVPVMMVYYRLSEVHTGLFKEKVLYEAPKELGITPSIIPRESLVPGTEYEVGELIRRMIVYSDNQALLLLLSRMPAGSIENLFQMLGVSDNVIRNSEGRLSVKEYAGFFRILFNSSFLSHENSEKALKLLSETDYNDAIPAGIPSGIKVSHKFGEAGTGNIDRQLHDCGIVYFPDHPYLLCVMTRGKKMEDLQKTIVDISSFVYAKIDEQH
jgi:beta-lactamase class A